MQHKITVDITTKSRNLTANVTRLSGGGQQTEHAVLYTQQFLTNAQKAQARTNIGAPGFSDIPQKTSELENDSGFITADDIPSVPTKTSELQNDSGFITAADVPAIPGKTSDLQNDSGFVTSAEASSAAPVQSVNGKTGTVILSAADVDALPDDTQIPTKTSELQNDSGFITESALAPYAQKTIIQLISDATANIEPESNTIYQCGELTRLDITNPPADGMYVVIFTSGATPTTTTIPATIHGFEDFAAEANMRYEINVLNNYALIAGWEVTV